LANKKRKLARSPDYNIYHEQPDRKPDNFFDHNFFGDGSIALINVLAAL
jgi:hypothetical protein